MSTNFVLSDVYDERQRQDAKWGPQDHGNGEWALILNEELGEATQAMLQNKPDEARRELIQVAAVAVAWIEAMDRRSESFARR